MDFNSNIEEKTTSIVFHQISRKLFGFSQSFGKLTTRFVSCFSSNNNTTNNSNNTANNSNNTANNSNNTTNNSNNTANNSSNNTCFNTCFFYPSKDCARLLLILFLIIIAIIVAIFVGWLLAILGLILFASFFFIAKQVCNMLSCLFDTEYLSLNLWGLLRLVTTAFLFWVVARYVTFPVFGFLINALHNAISVTLGATFISTLTSIVAIVTAILLIAFVLFLIDRFVYQKCYFHSTNIDDKELCENYYNKPYNGIELLFHFVSIIISSAITFALYQGIIGSIPFVFNLLWFPNPIIFTFIVGLVLFFTVNKLITVAYQKYNNPKWLSVFPIEGGGKKSFELFELKANINDQETKQLNNPQKQNKLQDSDDEGLVEEFTHQ